MQDYIQRIESEVKAAQEELSRARRVLELYPDAKWAFVRGSRQIFFAKSANKDVDLIEARRSCGCCADAAYEVWPYVDLGEVRVYSDPYRIIVGHPSVWSDDFDQQPLDGILVEVFPPLMINKINGYIRSLIEESNKKNEETPDAALAEPA